MPKSFSDVQTAALKIIAKNPTSEIYGKALVDQVQAQFPHKAVVGEISELYETNVISSVGTPKEDRLALTAEGADELIALGLLEPRLRPARKTQKSQAEAIA